jgi:hypothetical protein
LPSRFIIAGLSFAHLFQFDVADNDFEAVSDA